MPSGKTSLFVDTNILIYTLDPLEPAKRLVVGEILTQAMQSWSLVLSPQSINEFYRVVTDRRRLMPHAAARRLASSFLPYCSAPLDAETTRYAWTIQADEGFGWWDSLLLAAALRAKCGRFLSEDMQAGRVIGDMTIVNPFATRSTNEQ